MRIASGFCYTAFDNALAESVNGAYTAELVRDRLFGSVGRLEAATADWVCWWNERRLPESLGHRTLQVVGVAVSLV